MKTIARLFFVFLSFTFVVSAASANANEWKLTCKPTTRLPLNSASVQQVGHAAVIAVRVGYQTIDLMCSFSTGECVGFEFGSVPTSDAEMFMAQGQITGFRAGNFVFTCERP